MFRWCFLVCILLITEADSSDEIRKECYGKSDGYVSSQKTPDQRYEDYRKIYENCTIIRTNIEILFVEEAKYDFSFLDTIQEVHGYVLIGGNYVDRIRLNGLKVIRGWKTFSYNYDGKVRNCSLLVETNRRRNHPSTGLKELQLTSLVEITNGDVLFEKNSQLCFGEKTIDWNYIKRGNPGEIIIDSSGKSRTCDGACHENCTVGNGRFCWAEGPDMCQAERPCGNCSRGCSRCLCHSECIGGCTGSNESSCVACKNYLKGGRCVEKCNEWKYNQGTFEWEIPPTTCAYMVRGKCVAECPGNLLIQNGACVAKCIAGQTEDKTRNERRCVPCKDGICPKTCNGTDKNFKYGQYLHGNNLAQFNQCTRVEGNFKIGPNSFLGSRKYPKIKLEDLEILKDIEEITGVLEILSVSNPNLTSLSFLKNLRVIGGIEAKTYSLKILTMKQLTALNLKSLRRISEGGVAIYYNYELCYVQTINWTSILTGRENDQIIVVTKNANSSTCEERGLICSELCSDFGCWGAGNDNCVSCRYYSMMGSCVANCTVEHGFCASTAEDGFSLECRKCNYDTLLPKKRSFKTGKS